MFNVRFRWKDPDASQVFLSTSLDNWTYRYSMVKVSQTTHEVIISMPSGKYEYKFIVDHVWKHSNSSPKIKNVFDTFNNTLVVNDDKVVKNYVHNHKSVVFNNNIKQYRVFYPKIVDSETNEEFVKSYDVY
jgi:hypothetical protein